MRLVAKIGTSSITDSLGVIDNTVVDTLKTATGPFVLNVAFGDVWSPAYGGREVWRLQPC